MLSRILATYHPFYLAYGCAAAQSGCDSVTSLSIGKPQKGSHAELMLATAAAACYQQQAAAAAAYNCMFQMSIDLAIFIRVN